MEVAISSILNSGRSFWFISTDTFLSIASNQPYPLQFLL